MAIPDQENFLVPQDPEHQKLDITPLCMYIPVLMWFHWKETTHQLLTRLSSSAIWSFELALPLTSIVRHILHALEFEITCLKVQLGEHGGMTELVEKLVDLGYRAAIFDCGGARHPTPAEGQQKSWGWAVADGRTCDDD